MTALELLLVVIMGAAWVTVIWADHRGRRAQHKADWYRVEAEHFATLQQVLQHASRIRHEHPGPHGALDALVIVLCIEAEIRQFQHQHDPRSDTRNTRTVDELAAAQR